MVNISVVIAPLDDDGLVTILMITVTDDVAVPVTISVTFTNHLSRRGALKAPYEPLK
jgi:hypothetical protein